MTRLVHGAEVLPCGQGPERVVHVDLLAWVVDESARVISSSLRGLIASLVGHMGLGFLPIHALVYATTGELPQTLALSPDR